MTLRNVHFHQVTHRYSQYSKNSLTMHDLLQKKSVSDFCIWKQKEKILVIVIKLNMELNPNYFEGGIII